MERKSKFSRKDPEKKLIIDKIVCSYSYIPVNFPKVLQQPVFENIFYQWLVKESRLCT